MSRIVSNPGFPSFSWENRAIVIVWHIFLRIVEFFEPRFIKLFEKIHLCQVLSIVFSKRKIGQQSPQSNSINFSNHSIQVMMMMEVDKPTFSPKLELWRDMYSEDLTASLEHAHHFSREERDIEVNELVAELSALIVFPNLPENHVHQVYWTVEKHYSLEEAYSNHMSMTCQIIWHFNQWREIYRISEVKMVRLTLL